MAASLGILLALLTIGGVVRSSLHRSWSHRPQATAAASHTAQRAAGDLDWLDRAFADSGVPSLSMVVAQDGRVIWEQSWGFADVEGRVPATPQTMYSLASISKAITATGLMLLVERGQIGLDKPIEDYLGGLTLRAHVGDTRLATVRRVANHTGGLPIHEYSIYADEGRLLPPFNEIVRRYGILVRPPGERFEYSNLGNSETSLASRLKILGG